MTTPTDSQQFKIANPDEAPFPEAMQKKINLIGSFGRQKTELLNSPTFDIQKSRDLLLAYETAGFKSGACYADMRKRVEYYEQRLKAENENRNSENPL
jgi:hypothetical protein